MDELAYYHHQEDSQQFKSNPTNSNNQKLINVPRNYDYESLPVQTNRQDPHAQLQQQQQQQNMMRLNQNSSTDIGQNQNRRSKMLPSYSELYERGGVKPSFNNPAPFNSNKNPPNAAPTTSSSSYRPQIRSHYEPQLQCFQNTNQINYTSPSALNKEQPNNLNYNPVTHANYSNYMDSSSIIKPSLNLSNKNLENITGSKFIENNVMSHQQRKFNPSNNVINYQSSRSKSLDSNTFHDTTGRK
jgi:hypothetical protein